MALTQEQLNQLVAEYKARYDGEEEVTEGFKKGEEMIKSIQHKLTHHEQKNKG